MDSRLIIAGMTDEEDGFPINNVGNDQEGMDSRLRLRE